VSEARSRLEQELGGHLPPGLGALGDGDIAALVAGIEAARVRQRTALAEATDQGLNIVPKVLRGTVRKVLFG